MSKEGFFHRLLSGGYRTILFGYDFVISFLIVIILIFVPQVDLSSIQMHDFIRLVTSFAQSMVAIILVGIALLASMTHTEFLKLLKEEGAMRKLLFAFEATAMLSIFVAAFGIVIQVIAHPKIFNYIFIFLSVYLFLAVARSVSLIVSFGERRGSLAVIEELPDDLAERIDLDPETTDEDDDQGS